LFTSSAILFAFMISSSLFAQDATEGSTPKKEAVKGTFEYGIEINNQTVEKPNKKSLDIIIQHRFGVIKESDDLYGLFAPSNIRLGASYGLTKNISLGFGAVKNKRMYELDGKYVALRQMTNGGMPFTVTFYGYASRSALPEENFLNQERKYVAANRLKYMGEIMIARKFNSHLSIQLACTYTHLNIVDTLMLHDVIGASFVGRYKFSPQSSILVEFDYPLTLNKKDAAFPTSFEQKPNLGFGMEVSTGSHQFQIFVCTADAITYADIITGNQNDFTKKQLLLGFNITRNWGF